MKFPYAVKHNGIYYAPNTEIPEKEEKKPSKRVSPKNKGGEK